MSLADDKMRRTITVPDDLDRLISDLAEKSVRPISSQYEYLVRMALTIPEIAEQVKAAQQEGK
jgi:predicted transcriptional regulator